MQKRTREIIALVLLVVLCIAGIAAMAWYILIGHNWNAAASHIDDRMGSMDGYTVVVFDGVVTPESDYWLVSQAQPMLEQQNFAKWDSSNMQELDEVPLNASDAIESYVEKNAHVVKLDLEDFDLYEDPVIVPKNGKRVAIYSVTGPRQDLASRIALKSLEDSDIDFTICIADDLDAVERGLGNVDLAICVDPAAAGGEGRYTGRTYVVGTPYVGHVEAVVISPTGFLTSKQYEAE